MWVKTSITDVSGAIMTICSRRQYLTSYILLVMLPKIAHVEEQFQLRVTLLYFTSVEAVFFFCSLFPEKLMKMSRSDSVSLFPSEPNVNGFCSGPKPVLHPSFIEIHSVVFFF